MPLEQLNQFRLRDTGELFTDTQLRARFPNVSFPAAITPTDAEMVGADIVYISAPPTVPAHKMAALNNPALDENNHWVRTWVVVDRSPAELAVMLATAKTAKNLQINEARLNANRTSFLHEGKEIACDELSRSDIDAIAGHVTLFNALPVGFPMGWKAIDNSYLPLPDVVAFKAMYASMVNRGNINFAHAQALKAQLAAATTLDQVDAITW